MILEACIHQVGTECDKVQWKLSAGINDNVYWEKIHEAQALIYKKNWAVESAPVQHILKPQSLVPTLVSFQCGEPVFLFKLKLKTECIFRTLFLLPLQFLWNLSRYFYAWNRARSLAGPFPSSASNFGYCTRGDLYPQFPFSTLLYFKISHLKRYDRFRVIPTFGRGSIPHFSNNVSELKKLGARDCENLLRVSHRKHWKHFETFT